MPDTYGTYESTRMGADYTSLLMAMVVVQARHMWGQHTFAIEAWGEGEEVELIDFMVNVNTHDPHNWLITYDQGSHIANAYIHRRINDGQVSEDLVPYWTSTRDSSLEALVSFLYDLREGCIIV